MSLPDKCPFCGAEPYTTVSGKQFRGGDRWVLFSCDTSIYAEQDLRRTQSRKCEDAERARLAARVAELEAENKSLRDRFSDADTERNAAQGALKAAFARVAELEARTREAEESNANALARLSAAEARIELRRIENEAARHQVWHAENVCDAMEKRVFDTDARCKRLEEVLDTLTLVVGLTPIAGNKEALQEALDLARAELKAKEAKP